MINSGEPSLNHQSSYGSCFTGTSGVMDFSRPHHAYIIYLPTYPQYLPTHIEQAPVHILICTYRHRHQRDACTPSRNWDTTCRNGGVNE